MSFMILIDASCGQRYVYISKMDGYWASSWVKSIYTKCYISDHSVVPLRGLPNIWQNLSPNNHDFYENASYLTSTNYILGLVVGFTLSTMVLT